MLSIFFCGGGYQAFRQTDAGAASLITSVPMLTQEELHESIQSFTRVGDTFLVKRGSGTLCATVSSKLREDLSGAVPSGCAAAIFGLCAFRFHTRPTCFSLQLPCVWRGLHAAKVVSTP